MQPRIHNVGESCLIYHYSHLSTHEHLHMSYEMIVPQRETLHVRVSGLEHTVAPGEIIVIAPGTPHSFRDSENCSGLMVSFSQALITENDEELMPAPFAEPVVRLHELDRDVAYCLERLEEMSTPGTLNEERARAYLSLMFIHMMPALRPDESGRTVSGDLLYRAMLYMSQNVSAPLNIRSTARALGVNTYYLSHILNERLNMGFRQYLNSLRIDRARRLLRATSLPIEDIAARCGFTNLRTFDRVFIDRCSCTPRDFRKSARSAGPTANR